MLGDKRNEVFDKLERDKIVQVDNERKVVTKYFTIQNYENVIIDRYYYKCWDIYFNLYNTTK